MAVTTLAGASEAIRMFAQFNLSSLPAAVQTSMGDGEKITAHDQGAEPFAISLQELLEMDVSVEWLVEGLFPKASVAMLSGDPSIGKSWVAQALAGAVSTGIAAWGGFPVASPGPVLYVDEESSLAEVQRRMRSLGIPSHASVIFVIQKGLRLDTPEGREALRKLIRQTGATLVVLDSITRLHYLDENNAQEVARLMNMLSAIVKQFGCTILFVHHHRKPQQGVANNAANAVRGSTDFRAAVDVHIALMGKGSRIRAQVTKLRQGMEPPDFFIERRDEGDHTVVECVDGTGAKRPNRAEAVKPLVEEYLKEHRRCSRQELVGAMEEKGFSDNAVDEAVKLLEGEGKVKKTPKGKEVVLTWVDEPSQERSPI